ncbi:MAG TPA: phosphatidylserine/phosphatidylglycerophosphate/cardiolipin synthase family protein [Gammaproteobacteria bacterium]|jgi:cardiolipin synthase|nr:phosphatidylserine/phosphatidylglycerophosphate/cardiolipin synthase family protein [Gammaproteobacteria bacterium]
MADQHQFTWHGTGQDLLSASLEAIASARSSVDMETFTFRDSEIGRRFREALTAAAQRGVRVRLLVDAFGSFGLRRNYFAGLAAAGGAMRWFNELRFASRHFRDHRKLLVVDEAVAFLGGCNIAKEYWGDGITAGWRDGGVGVRGPVAAVLAAEFAEQWKRAADGRWRFPAPRLRRRAEVVRAGEVEVLLIRPGLGPNPLRQALRADLATAKDVAITSAYFLPSHRLRRSLAQAAARGARVRVLLAGRSDVPLMQLASRSLYRRLLRRGVEIWEYEPQVLHAKRIVIDDIVYVGSSNLDPRSLRINFEIMLRIRDGALAATARGQFEEELARYSRQITRDRLHGRRSWWLRFTQRVAYWLFVRLDPELAALRLQAWRRRKNRLLRRVRRKSPPAR